MINPIQQTIAYPVNVPSFINNFKHQVVGLILPHLLELKAFVNLEKNASTVNPLILVASILLVLYIIKNIWIGLFGKRHDSHSSTKESPELNAEVNQLKKQLKSLKTSFNQLIKDIPNQKLSQIRVAKSNPESNNSSDLLAEIVPLYTTSLQNNKKLVDYVLESQFQMLKELKRFKKSQRASLSSGRPSTSTIRSKTSDKKMQNTLSKSPLKTPINTLSSIKKPQIKNTEKYIRSQIHEAVEVKTQNSFLIKAQSPQKPVKTNIVTESRTFEVKQTILSRNGFQKVQKISKEPVAFQSQQQSLRPISIEQQITTSVEPKTVEVKKGKIHEEETQPLNLFKTHAAPLQQVQTELKKGQEMGQIQQETQVFVAPKLPVMKKMNLPKQGGKRPPPPPPKSEYK